ncbi:MAG: hypothetical protein HY049_16015 [Acidobacteria bacterium]|nr:hypothetical protein [Acidobacteriota bacterium]
MTREQLRETVFRKNLESVYVKTDQLFFWLFLAQWALAIALALIISPLGWAGKAHSVHIHVQIAVFLGGVINALPLILIRLRPGWWLTRHSVAVTQMLWAAILIHLTGGRIETHFHIFGSLAFIAFYRDWRVLPTATVVVAADHLARGFFWPESVYGISNPEWWRFLEHAGWVVFEDIVLVLGCHRSILEMTVVADREAALELTNEDIEKQVKARTGELNENVKRYRSLVENTNAVPWELDLASGEVTYIAPQAARFLKCDDLTEIRTNFLDRFVHDADRARVWERLRLVPLTPAFSETGDQFDYRLMTAEGGVLEVRTILSPCQPGEPLHAITLDMTQQKKLESDLHQAQKLESVGRLAAGVAHEINTPIQFVNDSIHFLREATTDLMGLVEKFQVVRNTVLDGAPSMDAANAASEAEASADLPYLVENLPKAFDRSLDGLDRVATIVRSMKEFAHPDAKEMTTADLNRAIQSTLTIARNEYKYVADLETDLGDLPPVVCLLGDINQTVLNLIVNAAHAIAGVVKGTENKGRIVVRTRREGDSVEISISDTGGGIPEEIRGQIFDPFFTTKEVGKGTGQGLAIARSVIVEKHGGEITFATEVGKGTTFFIRLPVGSATPADVAAGVAA